MAPVKQHSGFRRFHRDYYGGALIMFLGLAAVHVGIGYDTGTLQNMGPGFFPVAVGVFMVVLGVLIALNARGEDEGADPDERHRPPEWRGWTCIGLSIVAFVLIGKYGGLLPATFAIVFIAALGDRDNSVTQAGLLAAAMCVVSAAVFWWALQLQLPLFAWGG
ncbi:tripartite tricarboxylate transporter TctB [Burkholderia sp. WAC0059]|uniref:tripartite tricarboxylate transporter TctB family protein n=1 Tax=Burkholderia sp. WAC0059 TaxID=2066022 RepID=UPI000C7F73E0|nr:tripartite tricarboxylate transporter TctB family protein [Burkholderia sp. WAC0059]PLZ02670.1 tripartite tricarboxylate transporter TctB [Burkholderia sp. WAC0059]